MHHAIVIFDIYHRWLICTLRHAHRYGIYPRVGNITLGSSGLLYIILSRLESGEFYTAGFVSLFCHELFMIRCPVQCELRIRKRCLQNIIRLVDTYAPSDLLFFFCINCLWSKVHILMWSYDLSLIILIRKHLIADKSRTTYAVSRKPEIHIHSHLLCICGKTFLWRWSICPKRSARLLWDNASAQFVSVPDIQPFHTHRVRDICSFRIRINELRSVFTVLRHRFYLRHPLINYVPKIKHALIWIYFEFYRSNALILSLICITTKLCQCVLSVRQWPFGLVRLSIPKPDIIRRTGVFAIGISCYLRRLGAIGVLDEESHICDRCPILGIHFFEFEVTSYDMVPDHKLVAIYQTNSFAILFYSVQIYSIWTILYNIAILCAFKYWIHKRVPFWGFCLLNRDCSRLQNHILKAALTAVIRLKRPALIRLLWKLVHGIIKIPVIIDCKLSPWQDSISLRFISRLRILFVYAQINLAWDHLVPSLPAYFKLRGCTDLLAIHGQKFSFFVYNELCHSTVSLIVVRSPFLIYPVCSERHICDLIGSKSPIFWHHNYTMSILISLYLSHQSAQTLCAVFHFHLNIVQSFSHTGAGISVGLVQTELSKNRLLSRPFNIHRNTAWSYRSK